MLLTVDSRVAPHATSRLAERNSLKYLAALAIIPLVLYVLPFFALRTGVMKDWTLSYWGEILEHGYRLNSQNADVLVFGDSTATYDVDTPRISRDLGLKVINIPNTVTTLSVLYDETLRRYLAGNKPPRLIIFFISSWDTDFSHMPTDRVFEGLEMMIRHDSWGEIFAYARRKPANIALLPFLFYSNGSRLSQMLRLQPHRTATVEAGHVNLVEKPLAAKCVIEDVRLRPHSDSSIAELAASYNSGSTRTIVYLAPVPNCENARGVQKFLHPQLSVAPPVVLPADYFANDGWQAHMLASHISIPTDELEARIKGEVRTAAPQSSVASSVRSENGLKAGGREMGSMGAQTPIISARQDGEQ